ncbi:MAG: hypothetical protein Tsb0034_16150 [Ekhidna sp.]
MKKFWMMAAILAACNGSNTTSALVEGSQIPAGAIVQDYTSIPGLQRATIVSDGITLGEGDFLNGLHQGTWTTYDLSGKVVSITTYLEGKKQGVSLSFDNSGYVETKAYYHQDQLDGEYLVYKRRNIVERRNYSGGMLNGLQQKYYVNGTVMEESNYVDNKIDGVAKWYDQEGNLTIQYTYKMGELVEDDTSSGN